MMDATERPQVTIYTDGGCDPNPGPGGWGAVLSSGGQHQELCGRERRTTNNRMELTAAIEALSALKRACDVAVYTDSQYLRRGITSWVEGWQRNGWRTRSGRPVENQDLWQALVDLTARHSVVWHWVRGHQGNPLNERADELATRARQGRAVTPRVLETPRVPETPRVIETPRATPSAAPDGARAAPRPAGAPNANVIDLPTVDIYCRGSCLGNPGPGGYGAMVAPTRGAPHMVSGHWPHATNNIMELWAAIAGLRDLTAPARVRVHTTSKYVLDGASRWLAEWEQNGWRTRSRRPVQNVDLWRELTNVMGDHDVAWQFESADPPHPHMLAAAEAARAAASAA